MNSKQSSWYKRIRISQRLIGGFSIFVLLLSLSGMATLWEVKHIQIDSDLIVKTRTPTSLASNAMMSHINASLASLRGWMLTGNAAFKEERAAVWELIAKTVKEMDALSEKWTNSKNVEEWNRFKTILGEFSKAQKQVELIANSPKEQPATQVLVKEAAPRAGIMVEKITKMIDLELAGNSSMGGDRVQFLGILADVRGTLGLSLANIRAFLLTGDKKFSDKFTTLWAKNSRRFKDLTNSMSSMSPDQVAAYEVFANKRKEFNPLPTKMFNIRASEQWNMANYLLVREAAPRANKLLTILSGPKQADGSRIGGMVANQKKLLLEDAKEVAVITSELFLLQWVMLGVGVLVCWWVSWLPIRPFVPSRPPSII